MLRSGLRIAAAKFSGNAGAFEPLTDKGTDGLTRFLLKGGNQIGDIETAAAAGIEHVLQRLVEGVRTNLIA